MLRVLRLAAANCLCCPSPHVLPLLSVVRLGATRLGALLLCYQVRPCTVVVWCNSSAGSGAGRIHVALLCVHGAN
jgi:hypothetical protein